MAGSSWLGVFNSCALVMRDSSGGQVARLAMLSCSTGKTSDGVGMTGGARYGDHDGGAVR